VAADFVCRISGVPELRAALKQIAKSTDRATMYATRQGGRVAKQAARRKAPVYHGRRADVPPGRLKNAIASSKRLQSPEPGTYKVTVAPRGYPAAAYARQQEDRTPYMQPALDAAISAMPTVAAKAWERASRGRH
jgi:hypothetical protein